MEPGSPAPPAELEACGHNLSEANPQRRSAPSGGRANPKAAQIALVSLSRESLTMSLTRALGA